MFEIARFGYVSIWIVLAVAALLGLIGLSIAIYWRCIYSEEENRRAMIGLQAVIKPRMSAAKFIGYLAACIPMCLPFFFVEFVFGNQILVSKGKIAHVFRRDTIMWRTEWHRLNIADAHLSDYKSRWVQITMTQHPVTDNPKVRSLVFNILVVTTGTPEDQLRLEQSVGLGDCECSGQYVPLVAPVKSLLYELNEKQSKELAKMYNPLDSTQQAKFAALVAGDLAEPLGKMGAFVKNASFDIGN